jgi:hypothetical protein
MRHLLIGGPPGAGKTSVARRLARRHGLRLYGADSRTWEHRDRALAAGVAAARRWEGRSPAERWAQPPAELLATSLHRERGAMVLDDLAALPQRPLVVAEGSVVPPADPARSLWLIPAAEVQEARLRARGTADGPLALYLHLRDVAERDARAHGIRILREPDLAEAERHFAAALRAGPHAATRDERRALLREANRAIVEQVRGYHARPWAQGDPEAVRQRFVCECGDPGCESDVEATVARAAERPLLAAHASSARRSAS